MYVFVYVYVHMCAGAFGGQVSKSTELELQMVAVTRLEQSNLAAGNQTQVFWKSRTSSREMWSHLSSPSYFNYTFAISL